MNYIDCVPFSGIDSFYIVHNWHGLIQKEKVHNHCEKGAQISILANKIATQWWCNIIIKESKQTIHSIYFLFSDHYVHIKLLIWSKTGTAFYGSFSFT